MVKNTVKRDSMLTMHKSERSSLKGKQSRGAEVRKNKQRQKPKPLSKPAKDKN